MSIMFKEGMTVPPQALDQLVAASQSDIRQVLNMLSTWKLNKKDMNFDESKNLCVIDNICLATKYLPILLFAGGS